MSLTTPSGGIEELVDATSGKEIVVTSLLIDQFAELAKKYKKYLIIQNDLEQWVKDHVKEVLLPSDINLFLQQTREYENHESYEWNTGFFISQLIQNSHHAENTNFELDVNALKPIDNLASYVSGTEERMVKVIITGQAGHWCGCSAQYSTFTIERAGDGCGFRAQHSTFNTHNPLQYERFKKPVLQYNGNTLYLLSSDGSILKGGPW